MRNINFNEVCPALGTKQPRLRRKSLINTPNYYVQQLFSLNKGSGAVPILLEGRSLEGQDSVWASVVIDEPAGQLVLKIVNISVLTKQKTFALEGAKPARDAILTILPDMNLSVVNNLEHPDAILPEISHINTDKNKLLISLKPYSLAVLRVKLN